MTKPIPSAVSFCCPHCGGRSKIIVRAGKGPNVEDRIITLLRASDAAMTTSQIEVALEARHHPSSVRNALGVLVKRGYVIQPERALYMLSEKPRGESGGAG